MSSKENDYKVSVIIPTLNRINTLQRAIDSVIAQSFKSIEIIVVDNGSSDGSVNMLKKNYPTVKLIHEHKSGVSASRNKGIMYAKNTWIAFLDSDDAWDQKKLEKQINLLHNSHDKYRLIHTNEIWIRNGKKINQMKKHQKFGGYIFNECLSLCCISPSSVLIDRSIFDDMGLFNENLPVCEDYDMWLRICSKEAVLFIDEKLTFKYGGHKDQLSKSYWGMDRFRVNSIENLILNYDLNTDQKNKSMATLIKKLKIIINGAKKRNNSSVISEYTKKLKYWEEFI
jgi:glycosyltransferase involved in cell wall biosynthesis